MVEVSLPNQKQHPRISWESPPSNLFLDSQEVHIFASCLDLGPERLESLLETLNAEERARAARFYFDLHRNRFIAGRGFLRSVLGRYLGIVPALVEFTYGPRGKPMLSSSSAGISSSFAGRSMKLLQFNLAHCDDLALLAISSQAELGVDVERVRQIPDARELVARFFSPNETASFSKLTQKEQPDAFFNLWTRKEAWLKATGEGIAHLLPEVEVSFLPGAPGQLMNLPPGWKIHDWSLLELSPASGFTAAMAIRGPRGPAQTWRWDGVAQNAHQRLKQGRGSPLCASSS